jgi:hypothetical protein
MLFNASGEMVGTGMRHFDAGSTSVSVRITSPALSPGDYEVRVRLKGSGAMAAANESLHVLLPSPGENTDVLFYRAGPGAAARDKTSG